MYRYSPKHKSTIIDIIRKNGGFTLIELLVVISIIGLLSSVVISSVASARNKTKIRTAMASMEMFGRIVGFAQGESGKTLLKMSQTGGATIPQCSNCVAECASPNVLKNIPITNPCYIEWTKVLDGVRISAGGLGDKLDTMKRDPWGSPYLVDQNQGEGGNCNNRDWMMSAGPDGIFISSDDIWYEYSLPMAATCP